MTVCEDGRISLLRDIMASVHTLVLLPFLVCAFCFCENGWVSKCINVRFARQRVQGEEFNIFVVAQRNVND